MAAQSPPPAAAPAFAERITLEPSTPPLEFDPALHAENRARLVAALRAAGATGSVVLAGGESTTRHETDHEPLFRQESYFAWATGVREPDMHAVIDLADGTTTLFVPRLGWEYAVWMGPLKSLEDWRGIYCVERTAYDDELPAALAARAASAPLHFLSGTNTDSGKCVPPVRAVAGLARADGSLLHGVMSELRVFKTPREQAALRHAARVASEAHLAVMQHAAPGLRESQLESLFQHWCYYYGGQRFMAYTCICASGLNGAVLHYGHAGAPNSRVLAPGDLCLFDMGGESNFYCADITCTFPAGGVFSPDQRLVYEAVLAAVYAVEAAMAPGVAWEAMHTLALRTMLGALAAGGLLRGDVDGMMAVNLGATFMPCGLGHFLGLDTHDVGGYNGGAVRPKAASYCKLRTTRVLQTGMCITVEPGIYFIDCLLDAALADPARAAFIDAAVLARFRGFGGVRIEDDVLVTEGGIENLTLAPRTVADVEAACAGRITRLDQVSKFK